MEKKVALIVKINTAAKKIREQNPTINWHLAIKIAGKEIRHANN